MEPVPEADRALSDTERRFVEEWLIDRNNSAAYRRSFPEASHRAAFAAGYQIRHRPHVAAEIQAAVRAQNRRLRLTADNVLKEIQCIAHSDIYDLFDPQTNQLRHPRNIPYMTRKAVASVRVSRERRTVTTSGNTRTTSVDTIIEYKFWPKNDALAKLANNLGLNTAIPPLEVLLSMLPPDMAQPVREHMMAMLSPRAAAIPSTNGNGKH